MQDRFGDAKQHSPISTGSNEEREQFCILDATTLRYLKEVSDDLDDETLTFGPKELAIRYESEQTAMLWLKVIVTYFPGYFGRLQLAHV